MRLSSREKTLLEEKRREARYRADLEHRADKHSHKSARRQYIESRGFNHTTILTRLRRNPDLTLEEALAKPVMSPREAALNALSHTKKKRREKSSRVQPDPVK